MKIIKTPKLLQYFSSNVIWQIPNYNNNVFLTFDDCSDEDLTLWTLDLLKEYKITGTFFCTGKYIEKNNLHLIIKNEKHEIGNHGFEHLNGLRESKKKYVSNVFKNDELIQSNYFRPPYGKMKINQFYSLRKKIKIIMWSILTYDFDLNISPKVCFENVKKNIFSGAIIVFHTNKKSSRNLKYALPSSIEFLLKNNYNLNSPISKFIY